jgi:hypothetical protein
VQRVPRASFVATIVVWASAFSVIKALIEHGIGAEQIALSRYLVAAPGFAFLLWRAGVSPASTDVMQSASSSRESSSSPATTSRSTSARSPLHLAWRL